MSTVNTNSKLSPQAQHPKKSATTMNAAAPSAAASGAAITTSVTRNKIYDFFGIKSKIPAKDAPATSNATKSATAAATATKEASATGPTTTTTTSTTTNSRLWQVEELQQRIEQLQHDLQDKDEQLKAVSNNRTILHGALQSALTAREAEIAQLNVSIEQQQKHHRGVLEELVREQAERQAKQVREKLAMDGARLGRIVYTRAGLRQMETWEDGHASKQLREQRKTLKAKSVALAQRKEAAVEASRLVQQQQDGGGVDSMSPSSQAIGGLVVSTRLEAAEALASVEFHLANLARQEKELEKEEQALQVEKTAHIRALKRVASEDASRFRMRPKVRTRSS
jgi:hypothetical protein